MGEHLFHREQNVPDMRIESLVEQIVGIAQSEFPPRYFDRDRIHELVQEHVLAKDDEARKSGLMPTETIIEQLGKGIIAQYRTDNPNRTILNADEVLERSRRYPLRDHRYQGHGGKIMQLNDVDVMRNAGREEEIHRRQHLSGRIPRGKLSAKHHQQIELEAKKAAKWPTYQVYKDAHMSVTVLSHGIVEVIERISPSSLSISYIHPSDTRYQQYVDSLSQTSQETTSHARTSLRYDDWYEYTHNATSLDPRGVEDVTPQEINTSGDGTLW